MHEALEVAWVPTTPVENQLYIANVEGVQDFFFAAQRFFRVDSLLQ